jgi:hypothetical protein
VLSPKNKFGEKERLHANMFRERERERLHASRAGQKKEVICNVATRDIHLFFITLPPRHNNNNNNICYLADAFIQSDLQSCDILTIGIVRRSAYGGGARMLGLGKKRAHL